jgi:hypothetical protein
MRHAFGSPQIEDHFFEQRAQDFFAIAVCCGRRGPDLSQIGAEHLYALELLGAKRVGAVLLAAAQFRFGRSQIAEAILPIGLQAASHESVLWIKCY